MFFLSRFPASSHASPSRCQRVAGACPQGDQIFLSSVVGEFSPATVLPPFWVAVNQILTSQKG
jgi:hypothetical protein